jgi:hypothetical protein
VFVAAATFAVTPASVPSTAFFLVVVTMPLCIAFPRNVPTKACRALFAIRMVSMPSAFLVIQ